MYECESWTIKKAECWKIDAFELWCWRRLLRVPRTARRSNQSILKEINPECSLEGLMKLKLQYFGHLMRRSVSFEKTLKLGKIEGRRRGLQRRDGWMASPTRWTRVWYSSGRWWRTGEPGTLQSMGPQRVGHDWVTELELDAPTHWYLRSWSWPVLWRPTTSSTTNTKDVLFITGDCNAKVGSQQIPRRTGKLDLGIQN